MKENKIELFQNKTPAQEPQVTTLNPFKRTSSSRSEGE